MRAALKNDRELSSRFITSSAGISAYPGDHASRHSMDVMLSEWKIDISSHAACPLNEKEVSDAFLILTMTRHQKEYITSEYPEAKVKTYTLKEFARDRQVGNYYSQDYSSIPDITDPYGKPLHIYSRCAGEIKEAVDKLVDIIKKS